MNNTVVATRNLWNRDFSLLIFGQIISIFGNMILTFALPLYILDISGSSSLFGLVLGLSYIPLLIMSPVGGIIADRLRKQRIMFWLDASTTVLIVLYMLVSGLFAAIVPIIIVKMMALNAIQGMYMPAVQSSVPVLASTEKLVPANAVVSMVNAFSGMAGMAIAGLLYARFGLFPILAASAICFAVTAVLDLLIRIPFKKQEDSGSITKLVKNDLKISARYMTKDKPSLSRFALIAFILNFTLTSLFIVGVPVLITQVLGMGMELVGISQSVMMLGGLVGGLAAGILGNKLDIKKVPLVLGLSGLSVLPMGLVFMFDTTAMTAYIVMTVVSAVSMAALQMASIQLIAFVQKETPTELIGKVMSLIVMMPFIANATGQLVFGVLFEQFMSLPWVIVLPVVFVTILIAFYARRVVRLNG